MKKWIVPIVTCLICGTLGFWCGYTLKVPITISEVEKMPPDIGKQFPSGWIFFETTQHKIDSIRFMDARLSVNRSRYIEDFTSIDNCYPTSDSLRHVLCAQNEENYRKYQQEICK